MLTLYFLVSDVQTTNFQRSRDLKDKSAVKQISKWTDFFCTKYTQFVVIMGALRFHQHKFASICYF